MVHKKKVLDLLSIGSIHFDAPLTGVTIGSPRYASLLVTNEDTASVDRMLAFTSALRDARDDWELVAVMQEYMDVDQVWPRATPCSTLVPPLAATDRI